MSRLTVIHNCKLRLHNADPVMASCLSSLSERRLGG